MVRYSGPRATACWPFPSVVQAFNCAIAIQLAIARVNREIDVDEQMNFRIGINVGDVMVKNGDIFGDGVNIAARLEALADTGGICVTRGVRDHIRDRVHAGFEDMGEQSIKNIARPVRVFKVVFDANCDPVLALATSAEDIFENTSPVAVDTAGQATEVAFWESIRDDGDGTELRLYLERYPDGALAELARTRLERNLILPEDPAVELSFWESVRDSGNPAMIKAYIERYPEGKFASLAQILAYQ